MTKNNTTKPLFCRWFSITRTSNQRRHQRFRVKFNKFKFN